jgi:hypothetical protein
MNINNLDLMHHKRIIAAAILGVFVLLVLLLLVLYSSYRVFYLMLFRVCLH